LRHGKELLGKELLGNTAAAAAAAAAACNSPRGCGMMRVPQLL
jgi:hypothetical protein